MNLANCLIDIVGFVIASLIKANINFVLAGGREIVMSTEFIMKPNIVIT